MSRYSLACLCVYLKVLNESLPIDKSSCDFIVMHALFLTYFIEGDSCILLLLARFRFFLPPPSLRHPSIQKARAPCLVSSSVPNSTQIRLSGTRSATSEQGDRDKASLCWPVVRSHKKQTRDSISARIQKISYRSTVPYQVLAFRAST